MEIQSPAMGVYILIYTYIMYTAYDHKYNVVAGSNFHHRTGGRRQIGERTPHTTRIYKCGTISLGDRLVTYKMHDRVLSVHELCAESGAR